MEIEIFNPSSLQVKGRHADPTLRVTQRSGTFTINDVAKKLLGLTEKASIGIARQKDGARRWMIAAYKDGFLATKAAASDSLVFRCKMLAHDLVTSIPVPETNLRIKISDDPIVVDGVKWYPLMTELLMKKTAKTVDELAPKRF